VYKPLALQSVNGPQFTSIQGYQVPGTTNGDIAVRCVYLTNGASFSGFTLTNGATLTNVYNSDSTGGGLWCESASAMVSNCVVVGNSSWYYASGAHSGTLNNCTIAGNLAGGADSSVLTRCLVVTNTGVGVSGGTLNSCKVLNNSRDGVSDSTSYNCLIADNQGNGVTGGTSVNCTIVTNASFGAFGYYWGHSGELCILTNCIIYYNRYNWNSGLGPLYWADHCCTTPPLSGDGMITDEPQFVNWAGGDFHLQPTSPCIDTGLSSAAPGATDLDGNPRIAGAAVDLGAYEFQFGTRLDFTTWLQQYGLPTDGSADYVDSDGDGMNNWQEWICGTDPTNAASVLRMLGALPTSTNIWITWQSVPGMMYFVERATEAAWAPYGTNQPAPFTLIATNIAGLSGSTSFADTNATTNLRLFYRVGVGN
jgi:hypothetical protein